MANAQSTLEVSVFASALGWIAIAGQRGVLSALTFGHATPKAAIAALEAEPRSHLRTGDWNASLVKRLTRFAAGERVEFDDIELDLEHETVFSQRVIARCRAIPFGARMTYGQLAEAAGASGAARAVGSVMRRNRTPLVVPCHRVVAAGAKLGGYSAAEGLRTKLRLLEAEAWPEGAQSRRANRVRSRAASVHLSA